MVGPILVTLDTVYPYGTTFWKLLRLLGWTLLLLLHLLLLLLLLELKN